VIRFVCVSVGPRYGMEYVAILANMIARNASLLEGFSIECVTDRPGELPEGVGYIPAHPDLPGWWQKVFLFSEAMPWSEGDRIVYLDLDVCVTGRLEDLVERKGIIADWNWPGFNSSVMVWDHGEHRAVWDCFSPDMIDAPGRMLPADLLPKGQINGGDQEWLFEAQERGFDADPWPLLPSGWCLSYRGHATAWPPNDCKVVVFHGEPKPDAVRDGWVPNVWKIGGFTSLPEMRGVNVTAEQIAQNIRASVQRDLPWFTGFRESGRRAVVVGGGPSMLAHLGDIRAHKRQGASIITVNNAWRVLVDHGIFPDNHIMLDARPENAAFLDGAPEGVRYLIASQCAPEVFDALAGREVVVWHNGFGDNAVIREILQPWWDEGPEQRPCVIVPGGGTVGLRALWLCALSGFRTLHLYGFDSSYDGDRHHAYAQPINDADRVMEVALLDPATGREKRYAAARWMVRQAEEFRSHWQDLRREGVTIHVHGQGLLPDIARMLRDEARQLESA
jgi:uncharacterized Rossmann fold enzyme